MSHLGSSFLFFSQRMIDGLQRLQPKSATAVPTSFYVYDLVKQRTVYTSCPIVVLLGYSTVVDQMDASSLATLIHPDDLNQVAEHYQRFTTLSNDEVIAVKYRMRRADGTWCWLSSQETTLAQAIDGFPLQILGLIQDLTPPAQLQPINFSTVQKSFRQRQSARMRISLSPRRKRLRLLAVSSDTVP